MNEEEKLAMLAKLAGLNIDPAYHLGVAMQLRALLTQGELLTSPPLAAEIEPAPAYHP